MAKKSDRRLYTDGVLDSRLNEILGYLKHRYPRSMFEAQKNFDGTWDIYVVEKR